MSRTERDYRIQVIAEWRLCGIERADADGCDWVSALDITPEYVGAHRVA